MKKVTGTFFPVAIGVALAAMGLAIALGWMLRLAWLLELVPGYRMVFSTAAAFVLAGCALCAEALGGRTRALAQRAAGALLVALSAAALAQHLPGVDLGLDARALHEWLPTTNANPGRMAVPTALGFALAGGAFLALGPGSAAGAARALIVATGLLGAVSLAGIALQLGALFPSYLLTQIALPTASGLMLLAFALWGALVLRPGYVPLWSGDAGSIRASSAMILLASIAMAAIAGFALMQRGAETLLRRGLAADLVAQASHIQHELDARRTAAAALAARPDLQRLLGLAASRPEAAIELRRQLSSMLEYGFIALTLLDPLGRELAQVGALPAEPKLRRALPGAPGTALAWNAGFELETRLAVLDRGERLGELLLRQPLHEIASALRPGQMLGLCGADGQTLRCFPSPGASDGTSRPLAQATAQMKAALAGERGVLRGPDFRGADVIVAYAPLPALGLGATLRVETAQLFGALRSQLGWLALLLAALGAVAVALLRWQLAPLIGRLAGREAQLRLALRGSRLALWDADLRTGEVQLSAEWAEMRGTAARETRASVAQLLSLLPPEEQPLVHEHRMRVLKGELASYDIEHRVRDEKGGWIWVRSRGEVVARDARGRALRMVGTNALITERKERELAAAHAATHDALTGLANRRLFRDRLEQALARARRSGKPLAAVYLDMDRFKPVNDTHGHAAGDALLQAFAARLSACVRAGDTVARLGGDEFALVLEQVRDEAALRALAGKIVAAMRAPFELPCGLRAEVSASLGVAFAAGAEEPAALIERADAALYEAKRSGRDRYVLAAEPAHV